MFVGEDGAPGEQKRVNPQCLFLVIFQVLFGCVEGEFAVEVDEERANLASVLD